MKYVKYLEDLSVEDRSNLIEKVMRKYESNDYLDKELKKGREPRCLLYDVLLDYSAIHGKLLEISGYFPEESWEIDGRWIIKVTWGQGSRVELFKKDDTK